jgi:hypothetical protein
MAGYFDPKVYRGYLTDSTTYDSVRDFELSREKFDISKWWFLGLHTFVGECDTI